MGIEMFGGVCIIEDANLVDMTEDWSRVRSPGRARRRRRQGHRQNIRMIATPKQTVYSLDGGRTFIMHPVMAAEFRRQVRETEELRWQVREMKRRNFDGGHWQP